MLIQGISGLPIGMAHWEELISYGFGLLLSDFPESGLEDLKITEGFGLYPSLPLAYDFVRTIDGGDRLALKLMLKVSISSPFTPFPIWETVSPFVSVPPA